VLKIKAKFEVPVGVNKKIVPAITAEMEEATRLALQDWLQAVSGRVPIWSGMARGSLYEVQQLSGGQLILSPLRAKSRIGRGKNLGSAELKISPEKVEFEFSSRVRHWASQETRNVGVSRSAPWRALEAGNTAFRESFKKHYRPTQVTNLIETRTITV
jgi:hypothetical protein